MKYLATIALLFMCSLHVRAADCKTRPTEDWPHALQAYATVNGPDLAPLGADIAAGKYPLVDKLLVVRCSQTIYDHYYAHDYNMIYFKGAHSKGPLNARLSGPYNYFDPAWHPYYRGTDRHTMQSVTKSVTSVVLGVAITQGDFKASLDTAVLKYFDSSTIQHLDGRKRRMTLRHLLTMSAGFDWNEDLPYDDPRNPSILMEATDDWVQFVIDRPMTHEPGTFFAYSSGATQLLAHIFMKETGQDIENYASKFLFTPLGIERYYWKRTPLGAADVEGGLYLRAEDLAKIGELYLHQGRWNGQSIVSPAWVKQSLTPSIEAGAGWWYGYQWWLRPQADPRKSVWAARGFGGQHLIVFPGKDLIVTLTGWNILQDSSLEHDTIARLLQWAPASSCGTGARGASP